MNLIDVNKRCLGVNFNEDNSAHVSIWAPLADNMEIALTNTDIKILLEKKPYGYWDIISDKIKIDDYYKFIINNKPLPDPASLSQPNGVHEASQAIDLRNFQWTDTEWKNIPLEEYILYEIHTGTFTPQGTFEGIAQKLDYLKELGITAIEIMPVAQFPGTRNWGYDGVYPFAVQSSYGGAKALQQLVNSCHQKGIAVVLDVVYNHLGPEGNYLPEFGPYFTDKYETHWGKAINFDDTLCDGVRRYMIENALMWFRDFHIDALRLDAVHAIKDFSPVHILREIKAHVNELMKVTGRNHYLIVESDLNDTRFIDPIEQGGYGMDAQWIDEFHHAIHVTAAGEKSGYYCDFDGVQHLAKSYKDAYVYDGQFSPHRKKTFGTKAEKNEGKQFVVFSQNHDQVGNRMLGERTSRLVSFEMQKLLATAVIVSPFLPMFFMGEEWSEPNPFLYFVSHTDKQLADAVRKGRKEEFAAFHISGEAPDPMAEKSFEQSKLQWDLLHHEEHATMFRYYKTLIELRKQQLALCHLDRKQLYVDVNQEQQTLLLQRWHSDQNIICLMNFSKTHQQVSMFDHQQQWKKLIDSADPKWKGPGASADSVEGNSFVTLQPESALIYSDK